MKALVGIILLLCFISCSSNRVTTSGQNLKAGTSIFYLEDPSGNFTVKREIKLKKGRLISRVRIFPQNDLSKEYESVVSVSRLGTVKGKTGNAKASLPEASQFTIWFDKNKYYSQTKINRKTKIASVKMKSPEKRWNGDKEVQIPAGKYFCFFSQLPECLIAQDLLMKASRERLGIYIIWDSFPYQAEQYGGVSQNLFTSAEIYLSGSTKNELKYAVDIGNQIIFYHFNNKVKFEKMFWVSQGISLIRANRRE